MALIFLAAFFVRYSTLMDSGITWDERFYVHAGITYIDNLMHLRFGENAWLDNNEQPPVGKYIYGLMIWLFNGGSYDYGAFFITRVTSALMGSIICVLVYILCREFFNRGTAILASVILSLIPDFVAHTQVGALDAPVAFFFTIVVLLFMLALKMRESKSFPGRRELFSGCWSARSSTAFSCCRLFSLSFSRTGIAILTLSKS